MDKEKLEKTLEKAKIAVEYFFIDRRGEMDEKATPEFEKEIVDGLAQIKKMMEEYFKLMILWEKIVENTKQGESVLGTLREALQ